MMRRRTRAPGLRFWLPWALVGLSPLAVPGPVRAQLAPPVLRETMAANCTGIQESQSGVDDAVGESVSLTASSADASFSATAETSFMGPMGSEAIVSVSSTNCGGSNSRVTASASYEVTVGAMAPGAPLFPVPLLITTMGAVTITGPTMVGEARFNYVPPIGSRDTFFVVVGAGADSFSEVLAVNLGVGQVADIGIVAVCQSGTGTCDAMVDPVVEIDPSYEVEIEGVMVPGTDVYRVETSPVPEPSRGWLALAALGALGLLRFVRA